MDSINNPDRDTINLLTNMTNNVNIYHSTIIIVGNNQKKIFVSWNAVSEITWIIILSN